MEAETGIYQACVMAEYKIYDGTIKTAVESLIRKLRAGMSPFESESVDSSPINFDANDQVGLVVKCIREGWVRFFASHTRPSKDDPIGILSSILDTIELKRGLGPTSQTYIRNLVDFLENDVGVKIYLEPQDESAPALAETARPRLTEA